jgi:restriction system protein
MASREKRIQFLLRVRNKLVSGAPLTESEFNRIQGNDLEFVAPWFTEEELLSARDGISDLYSANYAETADTSIWCPDVEDELLEYFRDNPELMFSMPPRKFEELVAAIFRNNGYFVELTPETRDNGVDLIAVERSPLTGESVHLIECKRYGPNRPVGIGVVQRLLGVVTCMRATKGIVVTTSYFTGPAHSVAQNSRHTLALRDYEALTSWLQALIPGNKGVSLP